jgi:4-hydroxybenzoate polyprenyltransferase
MRSSESSLSRWLTLLRPHQWVKNGFVLAPLLFSGQALEPTAAVAAGLTVVAFCLLASGGYVMNDVLDREADRLHPIKQSRPIAARTIGTRRALQVGTGLTLAGLLMAFTVAPAVGFVALLYVAGGLAYSFGLRRLVIIDVFLIATFYVLRLVAGSAAIDVRPSIWLLTCGGLLALYLGFAKRRHEILLLGDASAGHRSVLPHYSPEFLDQVAAVLLSVTIVAYLMYTVASSTAAEVGGNLLSYSIVFVLYGVLRYLYLVQQKGVGGNPTETLLTDGALLTAVVLWLVYCSWAVYRPI